MINRIQLTYDQWLEEGKKRYGEDMSTWRFTCPMCKRDTMAQEWADIGAPNAVAISCIGRWQEQKQSAFFTKNKKPTGCDYAGFGLFRMNPIDVEVEDEHGCKEFIGAFNFAVDPLTSESEE